MKVDYKGFEINVWRENTIMGIPHLYFYIIRKSDGWFLEDSFTEGNDYIRDYIKYMKNRVDNYFNNRQDYNGGSIAKEYR